MGLRMQRTSFLWLEFESGVLRTGWENEDKGRDGLEIKIRLG